MMSIFIALWLINIFALQVIRIDRELQEQHWPNFLLNLVMVVYDLSYKHLVVIYRAGIWPLSLRYVVSSGKTGPLGY